MDDQDIKTEVKKGIQLLRDDTWTDDDLASRIVQLLNENTYRIRLERFIFHVIELQQTQDKYFKGDKSVLGKSKAQEAVVKKLAVENLKRMGITNIEVFLKKYQQGNLF